MLIQIQVSILGGKNNFNILLSRSRFYRFQFFENRGEDNCDQSNNFSGEIITKEPLDREQHASYDFVIEARDQGTPSRSSRSQVRITVTDINDNAPEIVDPQEDVVSVREEQPPGTYVARIRAIDRDNGYNASVTYAIEKGRDFDGYGLFTIDPITGIIRTRITLDHEERSIYRLSIVAKDDGKPPKQTSRALRVEVLNLNDNRPTFTSSSLIYKVIFILY